MISVEGLRVEFAAKPLFSNVSFVINDRDRIALVGKNGAGKSTMLKILCGMQKPTDGRVAVPQDTTIGYLPQVMVLSDHTTVIEETRKAFSHVTELKKRIDDLNLQLAQRTDYESDEYLNGLYHAQLTLLRSFDIDFTRIQVARNKGLTYEEMKEYLKQN